MKQILLLSLGITLSIFHCYGQKLTAEKTVDISKRANKGYLGNVIVDDDKQQIDLYYVTKSNNRKIKFEAYQFDYNMNLVNQFEDEQDVEKARGKYSWFNYRGKDQYTVSGIEASSDMAGKAVFKKKEITYTYNWFTGRYNKKQKILEKLKPKSDNGKKMYFKASYQLDEEGQAMSLVAYKPEKLKYIDFPYLHYGVLRVNGELDELSEVKIDFEKAMTPVWNGPVQYGAIGASGDEPTEWAILFQPQAKFNGLPKESIAIDGTKYTYIKIGRDGQIKDRIEFNTKGHHWKIEGCYTADDGTVYLYGPCKVKGLEKEAFYKMGDAYQIQEKGFEGFQIASFKDGGLKTINTTNIEEFAEKNSKPSDQKKPVVYNGKRVEIGAINITSNGDIFINVQEWSVDVVGQNGRRYQDFMIFHFDKDGNLIRQYGFNNPQKTGMKGVTDQATDPKFYKTNAIVFEGDGGNSVYWMAYFIKKIAKDVSSYTIGNTEYTTTTYTPMTQARIGRIDLKNGTIGDLKILGGDDTYLNNKYPSVSINGGKQHVLIGQNTKAKTIWVGKLDPSAN